MNLDPATRAARSLRAAATLAVSKDAQPLLTAAPRSVTRASLAAALRRHAPASDWEQLQLHFL